MEESGEKKKSRRHLAGKVRLGKNRIVPDLSREYGIVLEGGGARGAFQIGAWRALKEAGIRIRGISGVSVGALNGALMCMDDLDRAEEIWENLSYESVMDVNLNPESIQEAAAEVRRIVKDRGVDITPLRNLIHGAVNEKQIRESDCDLFVTTFSLTDRELIKQNVKEMPEGEMEDILMASAYFPAFRPEKLGGKRYTDGGSFDNVPISDLVDRGYENIIVIRIYGIGLDREKKTEIPEGTTVYHIAPREELGGVLEFDRKKIRKNMALGYLEGCRFLYGLEGRRYFIDAPHDEPYYFDRMMTDLELLKRYLEPTLDAGTFECLSGYRFYTEQIFPALAAKLKLPDTWNYKDLYLAVLEELAMKFRVNRYRVYRDDELWREVSRARFESEPGSGLKM